MSFSPAASQRVSLRRTLSQVRAQYQPIVDLDSGDVTAYEALARGPAGSPLERPDLLFSAAREQDVLSELDWACRAAALTGALDAGLPRATALFVNVEPEVAGHTCPARYEDLIDRGQAELRIVFEITERALTAAPAELLAFVDDVRAAGCGIALDDVGADWRSLALLPFLRPDVVKLDMRIVQDAPTAEIERVCSLVRAYAAESGAVVLAEGIETAEHRERARDLGAVLGQGWHFGRPAALHPAANGRPATGDTPVVIARQPSELLTPFQIVEPHCPTAISTKAELLAISLAVEARSFVAAEPCVLLGTFQTAARFTPATRRRYSRLAERQAFVGALGAGLAAFPADGVRGATLRDNETLAGEWNVIALGPSFGSALIAQDLGDRAPDAERRFRYAVVEDRALILRAARSLMARIVAT